MSTDTARHNGGVAREVAAVACKDATPTDAWVHGFAIGVTLALGYPNTARDVRSEVERAVAARAGVTPEEVEVYLRNVSDLFDRSLDQ